MQDSLAKRIRVLRAQHGLTLREAAALAGVRPATLSDIEHGRSKPHDVTLAKIAEGYGVPVEEMLEEPALVGKADTPETGPTTYEAAKTNAFFDYEEGQAAVRSARVGVWRNLIIHIGGLLQDIDGTYEVTPAKFEEMTSLAFTTLRTYEIENPKSGATPEQIRYLEQAEGVLQSGLGMLEERAEKARAGITSLGEYKEKKARATRALRGIA